MSETQYTQGTFCWWDLGTTSQDGARSFYKELIGWGNIENPMGPDQTYTMFTVGDQQACGAYQLGPNEIAQGIPTAWMSYIWVDDADAIAAKVTAAGGTLMMAPMDVMEHGRMAIIQDPTGAVVGLWQPKAHRGAACVNQIGGNCWNELATRDAAAAGAFYTSVFGWDVVDAGMPGMQYYYLKNGENTAGGMMQMTEEWGEIPPHWMPYIWVADTDATAAKATELGGSVAVPPTDIPTVGRFSVLRDPQGGHFSVITLVTPG